MAVIGNAPFQGLVSGGNIIDASIEGVDLSTSAIAARLGYTPVDPGAAVFSANPTISSGTTNQVQFLNGSKALVGSSNMTFNGTRLTVADLADSGLTAGRVVYSATGGALVDSAALTFDGTSFTVGSKTSLRSDGPFLTGANLTSGGNSLAIGGESGNSLIGFFVGNTEQMRLTTTGLGIGTNSPNVRTEISGTEAIVALRVNTQNVGNSASNYSEIQLSDTGAVRSYWRNLRDGSGATIFSYNDHLRFAYQGTERMRITSTGQLGLGTTSFQTQSPIGSLSFPQGASLQTGSFGRAWNPAQQIGQGSAAGLYGMAHTYLAYYDAGWKSLGGGTASAITIDEGIFSFSNSNGVGAGNSALTWTTRMLITTSGNVGIGTVAPTNPLTVNGSGNAAYISSKGIVVDYTGTSTGVVVPIGFSWSSSISTQNPYWGIGLIPINYSSGTASLGFYIGGNEVGRFNTAGNFGIGTTAPGEKLEVQGNIRLDGPSGTNREIYFRNMGSGDGAAIKSDKALTFYAGSGSGSPTLYMTLQEGGNLGIGTVSPTAKLHINTGTGGTAFIAHASSSSISEVNIGVGVLTAGRPFVGTNTNSNPLEVGTRAATDLVFVTNSAERARITSTGNLLVGYSADTYLGPTTNSLFSYRSGNNTIGVAGGTYTGAQFGQLYLSGGYGDGGSRVSGYFIRSQASGGGGNVNNDLLFVAQTNNGSGGSETERMRIDTNGNVGIGTTGPGARLHVRMSRTSSTSGVALWLSDNVAGAQTDGVFKSIRSGSNGDNSISEIRFVETDGTNNNTAIAFATQNTAGGLTERMRVGPDGNTAIGTTNPDGWRLNITGNAISNGGDVSNLLTLRASTNSFLSFRAANEGGTAFQRIISTDGIQLHTSNTERLRINPTGRVTIGYSGNWNDTAPYLHVRDGIVIGSVNSAALFTSIKSSNGYDLTLTANANPANLGVNANIIFSSGNSGGGGPAELMRIISDGRVGMGTASPVTSARLDVAGPIKSNRTVYNWFQWGGNPSGRFLHIKTSLWAGGAPHGNSQPTMSLFHIKGYNYDAHTIDAMIGFHNWVGSAYSLRITNTGSYVGSHGVYTSTDGFTVLVIDVSTSYPGISIDYFQSFPYGYVDVVPTASNSSTSATGVY